MEHAIGPGLGIETATHALALVPVGARCHRRIRIPESASLLDLPALAPRPSDGPYGYAH